MSAASASMTPDELAMRLMQQQLVARFGLFALEPGPLQRLLDETARVSAEGMATKLAKVLQSRPEQDDLLIVAGVGWHAGVVGNTSLGAGLDSPAGFALHTGEPVLSNNLTQEKRFRLPAVLAEHGVQSALNVIIGQPGRDPFGVLEVDSTRRHEFIQADSAFMQALSNVLSAGLARIEVEDAKDVLLRDKDLLVKEVHHRVSNSLQMVRTILSLQRRTASAEVREELDKASARIMSIAAVHRRLYAGATGLGSDAGEYLSALLDDLGAVLASDRRIELRADTVMLGADVLTSLGLVVSELVVNAGKYGAGRILVDFQSAGEGIRVAVEDEGPGFGQAASDRSGWGLGMSLISRLAKAGSVEIDRSVPFGRVVVVMRG